MFLGLLRYYLEAYRDLVKEAERLPMPTSKPDCT